MLVGWTSPLPQLVAQFAPLLKPDLRGRSGALSMLTFHGILPKGNMVDADARGPKMSEIIRIGGLELRFLRSKDDTGGSLDLFEMTVQPNARMPVPHYHESWDETIYGLDGVTTWQIDGQDVDVGPGQTAFIRRGVVHGFRNGTQQPAKCLCVLSPGALGPTYFRDIAALAATGAPDPARMKEVMLRYGLIPVPPA
jgi:quercetin dioxygenase-like cupin family protein